LPEAVIGLTEGTGNFVRTPTFQPAKMLQNARMAAMTGRAAAF
jgi:hypothetical protein